VTSTSCVSGGVWNTSTSSRADSGLASAQVHSSLRQR
jgi:hypothetical protein